MSITQRKAHFLSSIFLIFFEGGILESEKSIVKFSRWSIGSGWGFSFDKPQIEMLEYLFDDFFVFNKIKRLRSTLIEYIDNDRIIQKVGEFIGGFVKGVLDV